jgi:Flp pilus assembly pilin Flp
MVVEVAIMIRSLRKLASRFHQDTTGAMSVEKILILGLVALPILIILLLFRKTVVEWFQSQSEQLTSDRG